MFLSRVGHCEIRFCYVRWRREDWSLREADGCDGTGVVCDAYATLYAVMGDAGRGVKSMRWWKGEKGGCEIGGEGSRSVGRSNGAATFTKVARGGEKVAERRQDEPSAWRVSSAAVFTSDIRYTYNVYCYADYTIAGIQPTECPCVSQFGSG